MDESLEKPWSLKFNEEELLCYSTVQNVAKPIDAMMYGAINNMIYRLLCLCGEGGYLNKVTVQLLSSSSLLTEPDLSARHFYTLSVLDCLNDLCWGVDLMSYIWRCLWASDAIHTIGNLARPVNIEDLALGRNIWFNWDTNNILCNFTYRIWNYICSTRAMLESRIGTLNFPFKI